MTVQELIEKLSKQDPNKTVKFGVPASDDVLAAHASVWYCGEDDDPPVAPENDFVLVSISW